MRESDPNREILRQRAELAEERALSFKAAYEAEYQKRTQAEATLAAVERIGWQAIYQGNVWHQVVANMGQLIYRLQLRVHYWRINARDRRRERDAERARIDGMQDTVEAANIALNRIPSPARSAEDPAPAPTGTGTTAVLADARWNPKNSRGMDAVKAKKARLNGTQMSLEEMLEATEAERLQSEAETTALREVLQEAHKAFIGGYAGYGSGEPGDAALEHIGTSIGLGAGLRVQLELEAARALITMLPGLWIWDGEASCCMACGTEHRPPFKQGVNFDENGEFKHAPTCRGRAAELAYKRART
jgi:hypothetical protein